MRSAAPADDSGYAELPVRRVLPQAPPGLGSLGPGRGCAGGSVASGRFAEPCCAGRAVLARGLSDARSSQNWSSVTPPKDSVGHISSSMSAPLRQPIRRRGRPALAGSSSASAVSPSAPAPPARTRCVADRLPGLGLAGPKPPSGLGESSGPEPGHASPGVSSRLTSGVLPAPNAGMAMVATGLRPVFGLRPEAALRPEFGLRCAFMVLSLSAAQRAFAARSSLAAGVLPRFLSALARPDLSARARELRLLPLPLVRMLK